MKNLVPWLKSNWLIVVLCVIVLASLPTALVISSGMNRSLVQKFQGQVKTDEQAIGQNSLQYTIPSPIPGVADVEHRDTANEKLIAWFGEQRQRIQSEAGNVWSSALALNRSEHDVLHTGLFPKPAEGTDERVARADFTRKYLQFSDQLLTSMNAGPAPDESQLVTMLHEQLQRRRDQLLAQAGGDNLQPEQMKLVASELAGIRLGEYRRRAQEVSLYADKTVFKDIPAQSADTLKDPPTLGYLWQWQEAAWVLADLAKAIAIANAAPPPGGAAREPGVFGSVVKRIVSVKVLEPAEPLTPTEEGSSRGGTSGGIGAMVSTNPAASVTGRVSGRGTDNQLYDVRLAQVELIVDTQRLPELIDALGSVNFMTVIDMDLERVEAADHRLQGYEYGPSHVVKATMMIETLWLRDWVLAHMPAEERRLRGVEEPEQPAGQQPPPG